MKKRVKFQDEEEELDEEGKAKEVEEESKSKTKKIKEKIPDWKHVNDNKAIWIKAKEEI